MNSFRLALAAALLLPACGPSLDEQPIDNVRVERRRASVVVEGCTIDPWQSATLQASATRAVISEVILLCPTFRADGVVAPTEDDARAEVQKTVSALKFLGYRAVLGLRANDERGVPLTGEQAAFTLASEAARAKIVEGTRALALSADGVDLALLFLAASADTDLVLLARDLRGALPGSVQLGVFAPPSVSEPSDLPDGDAYDLRSLRPFVSRFRLMTLDLSCCGGGPGPTIDPGWAVDAFRLAQAKALPAIDIAYPLYGWDFRGGAERAVSYFEARGIAAWHGIPIERGPTHAPHYTWRDTEGQIHETWFDDATSTVRALEAFRDDVLPRDVGIVFYGLGAEDPGLFPALQRAMR
jgi:hypothetical protein